MLLKNQQFVAVGAVAMVSAALITSAALAVLGDKVVTGGAQGLASVRLSSLAVETTSDDDRDRLAVAPLFTEHKAASSAGFNPFSGSSYFQFNERVNLGIAAPLGFVFRDPDALGDKVSITGPMLSGNSFYRTEGDGSYDAINLYNWKLDGGTVGGMWSGLLSDWFGIGNGGWYYIPGAPNVAAREFNIPSEQQVTNWYNLAARRQDNWNLSNAVYYYADLSKNYRPFNYNQYSKYQYQDVINEQVAVGDSFQTVYRTDGGSTVKIKRFPFSPRDSYIRIGHDFAYAATPNGLTDAQVAALSPRFSNQAVNENLVPRYHVVQDGVLNYCECESESDREYYYGMLLEAFGYSDAEIEAFLDEVHAWEHGFPNAFDGYEQSYWSMGAAQAGPRTAASSDPQPVLNKLPNDGYFHGKGSWGQSYDDQWGLKQIGITATGRDGKGALWPRKAATTLVAVVDTGIDFAHPDLDGVLAANFREIPNNGKDDDGNGYVDDFLGWNFVDGNNDVRDLNGHGTFVTGIIAANTDNGRGIAGVNPWARILPVKVTEFDNIGSSVDIALGIMYAAKLGARVINVSIAGPLNKAAQAAVNEAVKLGALVVVAAGNEGKNVQEVAPAGLTGVITVAATNQSRQREQYSNWGPGIDIAAPGSDILSLRAIQTDLMLFADKNYKAGSNIVGSDRRYYRTTGTSFSAPYVAGVASLLFSLNPKLSAEQVKRMILQSASDIDVPGTDQFSGYGLLNAPAAVKADPAFFVESRIEGVTVVQKDGQTYVRVSGTASADRFAGARIEIGAGEDPAQWRQAGSEIDSSVTTGVLQDIAASEFAGAKAWTLRLIARHENGRTRENRFVLKTN